MEDVCCHRAHNIADRKHRKRANVQEGERGCVGGDEEMEADILIYTYILFRFGTDT